MKPQNKADELYSKFDDLLNKDFGNPVVFDNQIKQCALITVDELIYETQFEVPNIRQRYWIDVKQQIELL